MKLRLLQNMVRIKVDEAEDRTRGGIIIPGTTPRPVRTGVVLAVGPGKQFTDRYLPIDLKVGDKVVFNIASADMKTGKALQRYIEDDEVLVTEQDVLLTFEGSIRVDL